MTVERTNSLYFDKWVHILETVDHALQPIVNIHNGTTYGYEFLLRNYQKAGFETIDAFFNAAFNDNLLYHIDLFLRKKAIAKLRTLRTHQNTKLFFNCDARIFDSKDYEPQQALQFFEETKFPTENFYFELSEKYIADIRSTIEATKNYFKEHGLRFAVDDVGANFLGLKLMYYGFPDYVKVDRFFISDVAHNPRKKLFISNILNICRSIGCGVIAKSVETEEEYFNCREFGFDFIQGNFISAPTVHTEELESIHPHIVAAAAKSKRSGNLWG